MMERAAPKFAWGQRVRAVSDLYNDGSFPDFPEEALLVPEGGSGAVVQIGTHTESNTVVYMVEFETSSVIGCREDELAPA
jgi:nitrogen fixation protein NifZ